MSGKRQIEFTLFLQICQWRCSFQSGCNFAPRCSPHDKQGSSQHSTAQSQNSVPHSSQRTVHSTKLHTAHSTQCTAHFFFHSTKLHTALHKQGSSQHSTELSCTQLTAHSTQHKAPHSSRQARQLLKRLNSISSSGAVFLPPTPPSTARAFQSSDEIK